MRSHRQSTGVAGVWLENSAIRAWANELFRRDGLPAGLHSTTTGLVCGMDREVFDIDVTIGISIRFKLR